MTKEVDSLLNLKFDQKLNHTWFTKYIKNIRLVILLVLTILAIGISSLTTLSKRLNPEVKLTIVTVTTILPGAGPADVESLVTVPIEEKLLGTKGIDTITSSSRDNVSVIVMQFLSGTDKDKARNDVQAAVSRVTNLPGDAKTPMVAALDFEDSPIWNFTLTSNEDLPSLMRFAKTLQKKIEDLPNIDRVILAGFDTQEIQITLNYEKVNSLGLNALQVMGAVKTATKAFPAGSVKTNTSDFSLSIDRKVITVADIRDLHFLINGKVVRLQDIAEVSVRSKNDQTNTYLATATDQSKLGVSFSVYKMSTADIGKTVKKVEEQVEQIIKETDNKYQVTTINNTGEDITKQFSDVLGEFRSTLILVFINLTLFLGLRQALIASITIPLTFLLSFGWMSALGQTINFISLFALLLAFGTSIDDTIVTVSAMTKYFETKKFSALEAGVLVWRDFMVPIWTTTVTTVWAFLPLILTSGIIGEFIKPIPITVATTMYSSTAVAWFITLPLMIVLLQPKLPGRVKMFLRIIIFGGVIAVLINVLPKNIFLIPTIICGLILGYLVKRWGVKVFNKIVDKRLIGLFKKIATQGVIDTDKVSDRYRHLIHQIIVTKKNRLMVMGGLLIYAIAAYVLLGTGLVKNEFFPKTNEDNIYVSISYPAGTDNQIMDREARLVIEELRDTRETKAVIAEVGQALDENGNSSGSGDSVLFSMILEPKETRKLTSSDIAKNIRQELADYSLGKVSVIELGGGPPAGADVQISINGDDLDVLGKYADKLMEFLATQPELVNIDKSIKSGTSKIVFTPDPTQMAKYRVSTDEVGLALRLAASGLTVETIKENDEDRDIAMYFNKGGLTPEDISRINIAAGGDNIPLMQLGKLELKGNPTIINREAGKRTITVAAGVQAGFSVSEANTKLIKFAQNELNLPAGYEWKTGGVNEENQKSIESILRAMGLSFILIMATMVIEFGSYRQAAMILSLIPLAVSGVFYVFGLTGTPLSFPALIGVMALFGVVVTNAMFIVEKINQNRKLGMHIDRAIADAGKSRFEPILLTSLTSILGLIPITLANALWRGLGGAIISGLLFSGVIMLLYIPVMYKTIYANEK